MKNVGVKVMWQVGSVLAAFCILWLCAGTAKIEASTTHPIVGKWKYEHRGKTYHREFTRSGSCIMTMPNGQKAWTYRYRVVDDKTVNVWSLRYKKWLRHTLRSDGRLDIQGEYIGRRVGGTTMAWPNSISLWGGTPPVADHGVYNCKRTTSSLGKAITYNMRLTLDCGKGKRCRETKEYRTRDGYYYNCVLSEVTWE